MTCSPQYRCLLGAGLVLGASVLLPLMAVTPPTGLMVDGVPEVPNSIWEAAAPYWKVDESIFLGWDPKSDAMLIGSPGHETWQIHLLLGPLGDTRLTTSFPDCISGGSFMPSMGDYIIFTADHSGDEFYQLYRLDTKTTTTQLISNGASRNENVIYDHTGKQIAFLATLPNSRFYEICVMDPRQLDSRHTVLSPGTGGWILQDWSHDGGHILASHIAYRNMGYLWSINSTTGETTLLTKARETQLPYLVARYTPQDQGLYVITPGPTEGCVIRYLPLTNEGPIRKAPETEHAVGLELSPDGNWLSYLTDEHDSEQIHFFNTLTGEELPTPNLPPGFFLRMQWKEDSSEVGFNYGSATVPFEAYSYTVATRLLRQWTSSGIPLAPGTPVKPELVKIPSFDALEIAGYLYRPDPKKFPGKRPVLMSIHGGPTAQYLPGFLGPLNYYLNELGVALFFPNVRGSTGYGYDFTHLDDGFKREDSVKDLGAFLTWLENDSRLDGNRIGVQGASYGGYMTLAALYHYGNRLRCGSDLMGITDFVTFLRHTEAYRQSNRRYEYGDERYPDMNKFLESISPLNHVAEIRDPVMITAGKNDPRVPASESEQMMKALRAQNGIIWYVLGENEGHGFYRSPDAMYQFAAEANFFQTYLLPDKRLTPLGPEPVSDSEPVRTRAASGPD